ncbi:hypothetical protein PQ459_10275 [Chryseobacterium sp. KACC 21268]|nr:hypothetical protein PQ459_10275 [Chryseobacterium sp. KACC 21268]
MRKLIKKILKVITWPILRVDTTPFNDNGRDLQYCTLYVLCIPMLSRIYYPKNQIITS